VSAAAGFAATPDACTRIRARERARARIPSGKRLAEARAAGDRAAVAAGAPSPRDRPLDKNPESSFHRAPATQKIERISEFNFRVHRNNDRVLDVATSIRERGEASSKKPSCCLSVQGLKALSRDDLRKHALAPFVRGGRGPPHGPHPPMGAGSRRIGARPRCEYERRRAA
jgi:hypothetical protein